MPTLIYINKLSTLVSRVPLEQQGDPLLLVLARPVGEETSPLLPQLRTVEKAKDALPCERKLLRLQDILPSCTHLSQRPP